MVSQQFAKLRPGNGSCGFDPHLFRQQLKVMKSGIVNVSPILEFVKENPVIPCGSNQSTRDYTKLCNILTSKIPSDSGWYFWMQSRDLNPIYIGKADKTRKNNSLKYRINYELRTERICFWSDIIGKNKAFQDHHDAYDGKFDKSAIRAQRKNGTKFIVWISDASANQLEIKDVERILIDIFKPKVNVQRANKSRAFEKSEIVSNLFKQIKNVWRNK